MMENGHRFSSEHRAHILGGEGQAGVEINSSISIGSDSS